MSGLICIRLGSLYLLSGVKRYYGATADACKLKVNPTLTKSPVSIVVPALAEAAQLCIYDLNGRIVYRTEVPAGEATLLPYSFTHKGIYMVKIIGQGNAVKVFVE